jgi:glycosyltransferase involved in cell wall biosynthesis
MGMFEASVIIPTYNRAHTLRRSVDSVLSQKGVSFEVLLIDDGSTDETKRMAEEISQRAPHFRYFYESNQGPSAARNLGIRESKSAYLAFLDSDDEWLPGKLKAQLEFFKQNPDYLIGQTEEIWIRNGVRVNPMKKHQKFGGAIFEKCLPLSIVSPSCVMMKREFFDRVGFFDETLPACEDYDLWLRASARHPIGLIEKPHVIKYGGHSDQRSREFPVMDRFRIKALRKLIRSHELDSHQKQLAQAELARKCEIVSQGARKRGKIREAEYYERLVS